MNKEFEFLKRIDEDEELKDNFLNFLEEYLRDLPESELISIFNTAMESESLYEDRIYLNDEDGINENLETPYEMLSELNDHNSEYDFNDMYVSFSPLCSRNDIPVGDNVDIIFNDIVQNPDDYFTVCLETLWQEFNDEY